MKCFITGWMLCCPACVFWSERVNKDQNSRVIIIFIYSALQAQVVLKIELQTDILCLIKFGLRSVMCTEFRASLRWNYSEAYFASFLQSEQSSFLKNDPNPHFLTINCTIILNGLPLQVLHCVRVAAYCTFPFWQRDVINATQKSIIIITLNSFLL